MNVWRKKLTPIDLSWRRICFSGVTAYNRPMPIFVYEFTEKTLTIFVSNICNYYLYFHIPLVWFESVFYRRYHFAKAITISWIHTIVKIVVTTLPLLHISNNSRSPLPVWSTVLNWCTFEYFRYFILLDFPITRVI